MPQKEIINLSGLKTRGVNTNFTVGQKGDNGPADVMLIQALLRYITTKAQHIIRSQTGLTSHDLPKANGICDVKTNQAILKFQRANAQKLFSVDGKIHPASNNGRVIKSEMTDYLYHKKATPIMTITLLNLYAYYAEDNENFISELIKIAPDLKPWLN